MQEGESIEFSGKAIANLAADPDVIKKTGRILQVMYNAQNVCSSFQKRKNNVFLFVNNFIKLWTDFDTL